MGAVGVDFEGLGGIVSRGATANGADTERVVEIESGESGFVAAILVVVAGELDDVEADGGEGIEHGRTRADVFGVGGIGERGFIAGVSEIEAAEVIGEVGGEIAAVADLLEFAIHAA